MASSLASLRIVSASRRASLTSFSASRSAPASLPEGVAYVSVNPVVGSPVFQDSMPGGKTFVRVDVSE